MPLPETFTEALQQAQLAVRNAVAAGHTRLQVEIQTGRCTSVAIAQPILNALPQPLTVVFGTGTADLAYNTWDQVPHKLLNISERDYIGTSWQSLVLVDASSIDVDEVEALAKRAGTRVFLMINNWPEAPGMTGIGRGRESLRTQFRSTVEVPYFIQAFRYRPVVLFRRYPNPWQLWQEKDGEYQLIESSESLFTPKQLARYSQVPDPLQAVNRFFRGPRFFESW